MAMAAMRDPAAVAAEVAKRLGITTTTLYAYVNGDGFRPLRTPQPLPVRAANRAILPVLCRDPDWMPITPPTAVPIHADQQREY